MKIHLLRAEHFSVPGIITKAFATSGAAEDAAMSLVNIMLKDNGQAQSANTSNWRSKVEALQDEHGAAHCYVEIEEVDVEGAAADPARDTAPDMLAALREVSDSAPTNPATVCQIVINRSAVTAIRAAIAKAEGRS